METKFLKDALFGGMTSNAFKLGTVLSLGWFWQREAGCHDVYRGQDGVLDYDQVQAVMNLDDTQVSIPGQELPANTIWYYVRRQVSHCGLESDDSSVCIVMLDENGDMVGNYPNAPTDLTAQGMAGGKIKLRWRYSSIGQVVPPTGFMIYMDSGDGFDFDNPIAAVPYTGGYEFSWESEALTHGQLYSFCVRSYILGVAAWQTPLSHIDVSSQWEDEADAYDGNTETRATGNPGEYWLELHAHVKIFCTKIRAWVEPGGPGSYADWAVDLRHDGTWQNLFDGRFDNTQWGRYTELELSEAKYVTAARVKNTMPILDLALHELDFYGQQVTESQNTGYVSATADALGPDAIIGLTISWEEV
jgi:hypothetical protein